jgi:hypothetical protein
VRDRELLSSWLPDVSTHEDQTEILAFVAQKGTIKVFSVDLLDFCSAPGRNRGEAPATICPVKVDERFATDSGVISSFHRGVFAGVPLHP